MRGKYESWACNLHAVKKNVRKAQCISAGQEIDRTTISGGKRVNVLYINAEKSFIYSEYD